MLGCAPGMVKYFMSDFKFSCPTCGQHLKCDEGLSGRQISCPKCKTVVTVPQIAGAAGPAMPKSGMTFVPESWRKPQANSPSAPSPAAPETPQ
jgi:phage FluMu protein Com